MYVGLLVRCQFAKPWPEDLEPRLKMPLCKLADQKIHDLGVHWAKAVDLRNPGLGFADKAGLQEEIKEDADASSSVSLQSLRSLTRSLSEGPEPDAHKFKRGDKLTVV